jgi:hypothetical protein
LVRLGERRLDPPEDTRGSGEPLDSVVDEREGHDRANRASDDAGRAFESIRRGREQEIGDSVSDRKDPGTAGAAEAIGRGDQVRAAGRTLEQLRTQLDSRFGISVHRLNHPARACPQPRASRRPEATSPCSERAVRLAGPAPASHRSSAVTGAPRPGRRVSTSRRRNREAAIRGSTRVMNELTKTTWNPQVRSFRTSSFLV